MEQVWVVPRSVLFEEVPSFQGFLDTGSETLTELANRLDRAGFFRPRDSVEDDPSLQQIIPYVAIRHDGQYLRLRRLATQGEARLHDRLSLGIGGHVNPEPEDGRPLLLRGLEREVTEELNLSPPVATPTLLGLINDDSNDVGAVHFGVAALLDVDHPVTIRESDRMVGEWCDLDAIEQEREGLESWSALLLDRLRTI